MDLGIRDRVALVTGGGRGIGSEICLALSREGAYVAVNDIVAERAESVATEIVRSGGRAIAAPADVADGDAVLAMVHRVQRELGAVDILVNNAGPPPGAGYGAGAFFGPFAESDRAFWERQMNVIIFGVLHCTRAVIGGMMKRRWGRIINISSDAGRVGRPELTIYSMSKAGVVGFSKALAQEVGPHCVTVNCVSPGATETESASDWLRDFKEQLIPQYPMAKGLGRLGLPGDVAGAVAFLASTQAEWITGQVLSVNGGRDMVD